MLEKEKIIEITAREAPYALEEQLGTYKLKRWTWYEKQVCMQRATTIIDAKQGLIETPMPDYNTHMVIMCLVESPLKLTGDPNLDFEMMKNLDADVGDILFQAAGSMNTITPEEKKDFLPQPESTKTIPG